MRLKVITISLLVVGSLCLVRGEAWSQNPGSPMPADCKNKQPVQYRSSGSFVSGDTSKVKCTVDYWICEQPFSKSQIVQNIAGACDTFRDSVVSSLPKEACCDCYPNCGNGANQPQKQDCCGDVQQLKEQVKQLEARVKQLEDKLNGDDITLGSGASNIRISNTKDNKGVSINSDGDITIKSGGRSISISSSGDVSIKAGGNLSLKGAKVTQN